MAGCGTLPKEPSQPLEVALERSLESGEFLGPERLAQGPAELLVEGLGLSEEGLALRKGLQGLAEEFFLLSPGWLRVQRTDRKASGPGPGEHEEERWLFVSPGVHCEFVWPVAAEQQLRRLKRLDQLDEGLGVVTRLEEVKGSKGGQDQDRHGQVSSGWGA
jgi:hypothetical protein